MGIYIGTSGWSYDHWENIVYPAGTKSTDRLNCYLNLFKTVELNSSFYHWPRDKSFISWANRLPDDFILTVKAPRNLTHFQKLYKPEYWIERIVRSIEPLNWKMGVLLFQMPPSFGVDYPRLDYFLRILPQSLRIALEFRHQDWHQEETFQKLAAHNKAYCIMSGAFLPCVLRATADFVYVRMHGPDNPNQNGSYSEENLQWWAQRIKEWRLMGKDVYVYFNNDWGGHAVHNALRLKEIVKSDSNP
jgi:uncharacterized protein YecE (DUF72 family)